MRGLVDAWVLGRMLEASRYPGRHHHYGRTSSSLVERDQASS